MCINTEKYFVSNSLWSLTLSFKTRWMKEDWVWVCGRELAHYYLNRGRFKSNVKKSKHVIPPYFSTITFLYKVLVYKINSIIIPFFPKPIPRYIFVQLFLKGKTRQAQWGCMVPYINLLIKRIAGNASAVKLLWYYYPRQPKLWEIDHTHE